MAKIKITPLRSFFDNGKGFFVGKKYSVDEERAQAYLLEGWAELWSEEKYGAAQTDGGDDDDDFHKKFKHDFKGGFIKDKDGKGPHMPRNKE